MYCFLQHSFDKRCQQLLNDEDYAGAITELKRCQKVAIKYRHFSCVAALTYKLQETLENTDTQFDRILAQVSHFREVSHIDLKSCQFLDVLSF